MDHWKPTESLGRGARLVRFRRASSSLTYVPYDAAGPDSVVDAQPALVVRVLSGAQHVLVAHVVWSLVDYPESSLHSDGVAAAEVPVQVAGVAVALIEAALEVFVLVEDDLGRKEKAEEKKVKKM